jgi:hypothetical protein
VPVINLFSPVSAIQQSSLCLKTPSPELRVIDVINLVSPVTPCPKSKRLKVELFSPKRDTSFEHSLNVLPKKRPFTINLITPPSKLKLQKVEPSEPFTSKRDTSIECSSIVFSEPEKKFTPSLHPAPVHACESGRFPSLDAAILAVCDEEESLGHKWVKGQTKKTGGEVRRITMRCNHYRFPTERHSVAIDPANHRQGRSNKTDCKAHVNIIRDPESALWMLNVPDWVHNHAPDIPLGGKASRPPTKKLQDAISTIATTTNLDRADISKLIKEHPEYDSKHPLEPRQITNIVNAARRNARNEVIGLGGDVNAVVGWL